jgi:V/A-type H+-transporting ATPase subunit K
MYDAIAETAGIVLDQHSAIPALSGAALGVGLAALGAGIAERGIGAAAVGALAEDSISLGYALLMTVLPETLVILAMVVYFIVQFVG